MQGTSLNWQIGNLCAIDSSSLTLDIFRTQSVRLQTIVLWRDLPHKMDDLPNHPVMQRWWAHMADIMETHPNNEPQAKPLLNVFHME